MIDFNSIRFRVAAIVSTAVVLSLGGLSLYLSSEIRGINEREETTKMQSTNQLVLNMIAQTDSILRQQVESWAHTFTNALTGTYTLRSGSGESGSRISDISASMGDRGRRRTGAESNEKTETQPHRCLQGQSGDSCP